MAKKSVSEVISEELTAKRNDKGKILYNRFSKSSFNKLLTAMANDPECSLVTANVKNNEIESTDEIKVFEPFRKWCKKLVEKLGVDKSESDKVLSEDFTIDNMDGFYEFMAVALYKYIEAGNKFKLYTTEDFEGNIYLEEVDETESTGDVRNVSTGENLGTYKTTKKKHKRLKVDKSCPKWLMTRTRV